MAVKLKDASICDNIGKEKIFKGDPEDYKWFCYEEVAHAKKDPSICESIPEDTYNEHGVNTNRRDRCFEWFN